MAEMWTLVTGASGFVGGRLVHALIERGDRVKAFVRAGANLHYLEGLPADRFRLAFGDITIGHTVYRALAGCDRMYHVATNYKMWDRNPERILEPAVEGTRATLLAAKRRGLEKIVVTSSVAALGVSVEPEPMDEEHEFNLEDPNLHSQQVRGGARCAELADEGMPIVVVLPASVFRARGWKPTPSGQGIVRCQKMPPSVNLPVTEAASTWSTWRTGQRPHLGDGRVELASGTSRQRERDFPSFFETLSS
jgi:dihydroflavonol-4-reductase